MAAVRIDFYVLEENVTDGRFRLACKIIDRAYRSGYSVYLWTVSYTHLTLPTSDLV